MSGRAFVFLGSMNAMPMVYAQELKKEYEVLYFVDRPPTESLSRPESHYEEIKYPYPSWIIEWLIPTQAIVPLLRSFFTYLILIKVKKNTKSRNLTFVLNGLFISLAPFLAKHGRVIALSHGSDLMQWGNINKIPEFKVRYKTIAIYRYLPKLLSCWLIELSVKHQWSGFLASNAVIYFPRGFGAENDRLINLLEYHGVKYFPRFDVSFNQLSGANRNFKTETDKFVIFSGARQIFSGETNQRAELAKGSDLIILALAEFYNTCPNLEIHLIEKGPDTEKAKKLCSAVGLDSVVIWHSEMPFRELIKLYELADICFDSVGESWMGAVGAHALWMGKPLIANVAKQIEIGWFPEDCPIANCSSIEQIVSSLHLLLNQKYRHTVSEKSKKFAADYFSPNKILNQVFRVNIK